MYHISDRLPVDRNVNAEFKFNQETEFVPIAGLVEAELNGKQTFEEESGATSVQANHHAAILSVVAEELSVAPSQIHDFEL